MLFCYFISQAYQREHDSIVVNVVDTWLIALIREKTGLGPARAPSIFERSDSYKSAFGNPFSETGVTSPTYRTATAETGQCHNPSCSMASPYCSGIPSANLGVSTVCHMAQGFAVKTGLNDVKIWPE